ncbi:MAG: hypothetical protein WA659_01565 [Candidatus Aquirickettsiella sp.]
MPKLTLPYAPIVYANNYNITYNEEDLKKIATTTYEGPTGISHQLNEFMQTPNRWIQFLLGIAGEQKINDLTPKSTAIKKILASLGIIVSTPVVLPFALISIPTAALKQSNLPPLRYVSPKNLAFPTYDPNLRPLHVKHFNTGFGPGYKRKADALETAKISAKVYLDWFSEHKTHQLDNKLPDLIFFQELFDINSKEMICQGLKDEYPYQIHSVAPHIFNMDSGQVILSKFPIVECAFSTIKIVAPDNITAPRVILMIRIATKNAGNAIIELYNLHTTPLLSEQRCKYRADNINQFFTFAYERAVNHYAKNNTPLWQIAVGDLNLHFLYTPFNKRLPFDHQEAQLYKSIEARAEIVPYSKTQNDNFLECDRILTGVKDLTSPPGTWIYGPKTSLSSQS